MDMFHIALDGYITSPHKTADVVREVDGMCKNPAFTDTIRSGGLPGEQSIFIEETQSLDPGRVTSQDSHW